MKRDTMVLAIEKGYDISKDTESDSLESINLYCIQKWLRNDKHINVLPHVNEDGTYDVDIYFFNGKVGWRQSFEDHIFLYRLDTFEEALEAGIRDVMKMVDGPIIRKIKHLQEIPDNE